MKVLAAIMLAGLATGQAPPLVELQGVCSIDEKGVSCWSTDGTPQPRLTQEVDRRVRAMRFGVGFVTGRKNRYAVVKLGKVAWYSAGGGERPQTYALSEASGEPLTLFRLAALPNESSGTVQVTMGVDQGSSVDLPLRQGTKTAVDGVSVEIGPIGRNPAFRQVYGGYVGGRNPFTGGPWRVAIDQREADPSGRVFYEAMGRDGKPIRYVDEDGRPISAAVVDANRPDYSKPVDWTTAFRYETATFGTSFPDSPSSLWVYTNIDPKRIAKLRLRHVVTHAETVGPFALDPVQPRTP